MLPIRASNVWRVAVAMTVLAVVIGLVRMSPTVEATPFPGPDEFGYTGSVIPTALRTLTDPTSNNDSDDGVEPNVQIGFPVTFYGVTYEEVDIHSNGLVSFDGGEEFGSSEPIPTSFDSISNFIAGVWTDLTPIPDAGPRYQVLGTTPNREFVVEWNAVPYQDSVSCGAVTFQVILKEGNPDIEVQYGQIDACRFDISLGIENEDGDIGLETFFGEATAEVVPGLSNRGILYHPVPIPPVPDACANMRFDRTIIATGTSAVVNGSGLREYIVGTDGNDRINGGGGNDCIVGGEGNDTITGGSGNDKLIGGAGSDTLKGDSGTDWADGGAANDTCDAESRINCP